MLPILQVGPLALPLPPLLVLLGLWLGLEWTERHAPRYGVEPAAIYRLTLVAILAGIIGARIAYALKAPGAFAASPLSLLAPRPQMLDAQGGLLFAFFAALIYGQRQRMALWPALDALTTLFGFVLLALGLSHLASGEAYGAPASLPWAIDLWGARRHPAQVYETLAAALTLIVVWPASRLARLMGAPGLRFWTFTGLSALARLFLEAFRGDSALLFDRFRAAQGIAWLILAAALWQIAARARPPGSTQGSAAIDTTKEV